MTQQATARALFGLGHDLTDEELLTLTESHNRPALKEFLAKRAAQAWFQTTYHQDVGLRTLIEAAVGPRNVGNINSDITQERFPLAGNGIRQVNPRVEPYLDGETSEQAAKRLMEAGHTLASTGDLAGFLHDHPTEVEKWAWVLAISEDSRWADLGGYVCVPCAGVYGAYRYFSLRGFRHRLDSGCGVLVLSE